MRTWPNFIPTGTSKKEAALKQRILEESDRYLRTYMHYRKMMEQKKPDQWKQKILTSLEVEPSTYVLESISNTIDSPTVSQLELMFGEVANTILTDPLLSQSYWNPEWYPPVPEYTPPKWRRLSTQEVVEIWFKIAQARANTETRKVVDSENFWDAWVYVTETMPTVEEFNELNQDIDTTTVEEDKIDILPLVDSNRFYTEVALMSTIEGTIENKNYQYPNIVERIKWRVDYYCADEWNTLLWVHVYSDSDAISEVTEFLADNPVSNGEEQNEAIVSLSQAYWELSKNNK